MKKVINFLLIFILVFSLTGCLSKEEKQLKKQYEKQAREIMTEFFDEHYENYEITKVEQLVIENAGSVYSDLSESTEIFVKIDGQEYTFYYNQITKDIFSNINLKKVNKELLAYLEQSDFPQNFYNNTLSLKYENYDFNENVLHFDDDTLEKVMKRNDKAEKACYSINGNFYYIETPFSYENFNLSEFASEFRKINLTFYNVNEEYDKAPFDFNIIEQYRFSFDDHFDEKLELDIYEFETIDIDGIKFVYTPRYFTVSIEKSIKKPEKLTDDIYNKKYENDGVWYAISSTKLYDTYPSPFYGNDMEITYSVSPGVSIFTDTFTYKTKGLYEKSRSYADDSNTDEDYMRFFVFCDDYEEMIQEITFVELKR